VTSEPGSVGQQRREALHPPKHGHVIHLDTTLDQQLLDVAVGQVEPQVPADRDHDHVGWEPESGERRHGADQTRLLGDLIDQACLNHVTG